MLSVNKTIKTVLLASLFVLAILALQSFTAPVIVHAQATDGGGGPTASPTPQSTNPGSSAFSDFCTNATFTVCAAGIIYAIAVGFGAYIATICAVFLDYAVFLSLNSTSYGLKIVSEGWTIMRDLANMAFIFILVYVAFTVMFRAETTNTLKQLAAVVVLALLVNFSFLFTRMTIDVGNILAVQFYNAIRAGALVTSSPGLGPAATAGGSQSSNEVKDLTGPIMDAVRVQSLIGSENLDKLKGAQNSWTTFIALSVVFLVLGVMLALLGASFLFAGVKFILRIVGLWFVIIAAPLAFAARALPGNTTAMGFFNQWRSFLVSFTFYPAVYLFIFYIVVLFAKALSAQNLITAPGTLVGSAATTDPSAGSAGLVADISIRVAIICVLLFVAYVLADKIVQAGNQMTKNVFGWAGKTIGGGFRGGLWLGGRTLAPGVAFAGRNTLGRLAYGAVESGKAKEWESRRGLWGVLGKGTKRLSGATYDIRNAPGGGIARTALSGVDRVASLGGMPTSFGKADVGKGATKTFEKIVEQKGKRYEARGKALKATEEEAWTEQQRFTTQFEQEHGMGSYSTRINELQERINTARAAAEHWKNTAVLDPSQAARFKLLEDAERTTLKQTNTELKALAEAGKNVVEARAKQRIATLADNLDKRNRIPILNPSWGRVEGAARLRKMIGEKGAKEKAKEALDALKKEDEDDTPPPSGGGAAATAPSASLNTNAVASSSRGGPTVQKASVTSDLLKQQTTPVKFDEEQMRSLLRKESRRNIREIGQQISEVRTELHQVKKVQERLSNTEVQIPKTESPNPASTSTKLPGVTLTNGPAVGNDNNPLIRNTPAVNDNVPPTTDEKKAA